MILGAPGGGEGAKTSSKIVAILDFTQNEK